MKQGISVGVLLVAFAVHADSLLPVGVLGNSGEAGDALVRAAVTHLEPSATGIAVGDDWSLWYSGGDRINRLSLDGRLIGSYALEPPGSRVDSRTFALVKNRLYFFGRLPDQRPALFALDLADARAAVPIVTELPARKHEHQPYCLAPQNLDGRLVIVTELPGFAEPQMGVYLFEPETKSLRQAFAAPGSHPSGVAIDPQRRVIYLGALCPTFGGQAGIAAFSSAGDPLADFPVACTKAVLNNYHGFISWADGALWESGGYGFLARLDRRARGQPGTVSEWYHELGLPTQLATVAEPGLIAVAAAAPDALYLADWDNASRQLHWSRRIGCLPVVTSLGLSPTGWVTVGTGRSQVWWRFDDAADAPPRKGELHIAVTPGVFDGERFLALAARQQLTDLKQRPPMAAVFTARPSRLNEALVVAAEVPLKSPVGLSAAPQAERGVTTLFVSDAATRQVWQTSLRLADLNPDNNWRPVSCANPAVEELLATATDLAALPADRLLVAVTGQLVMLRGGPQGYAIDWQLPAWGDQPDQRFGPNLRLAVDGPHVLVADTDRQRVLLFDWTTQRWLAQLGATDKSGTDLQHLDRPTLVSLAWGRAVIADTGNQRVVKVLVLPEKQ